MAYWRSSCRYALYLGTQSVLDFNDTDDLLSGITVGAVVVPQSMAYAALANLDPQFGLYSSFMGVLIYWFFATSKDITIGVSKREHSGSNEANESLSR